MRQGLFGSGGGHLSEGRFSEGAAGRGEDQALDFFLLAGAEALANGIVLAVDRKQFDI